MPDSKVPKSVLIASPLSETSNDGSMVFNACAFGADPTGKEGSTLAFRRWGTALAAAKASGRAVSWVIPAGTYIMDKQPKGRLYPPVKKAGSKSRKRGAGRA